MFTVTVYALLFVLVTAMVYGLSTAPVTGMVIESAVDDPSALKLTFDIVAAVTTDDAEAIPVGSDVATPAEDNVMFPVEPTFTV